MRLQAVFFAAVLAGCAVEPEPEVSQLRQAALTFPQNPQHRGWGAGAQLGTSVAACRTAGYVAGAAGDNATLLVVAGAPLWFVDPGTTGDAGATGRAVACDDVAGRLVVVTAGDEGAFALGGANGGTRLAHQPVRALARGPSPAEPLLVGVPGDGLVIPFLLRDAGYFQQGVVPTPIGTGAALLWHPAGVGFVAGNPQAGYLIGYPLDDGGTVYLNGPPDSGFGAALAFGDVHPSTGVELIVGAPRASRVLIFSQAGVPLMTLDGLQAGSAGFGTSLAIEPSPAAGGLQALWVGDPSRAQVFRFIGDAGTRLSPPFVGGTNFGFSMAVSEDNLVVGAPLFSDTSNQEGAVYVAAFNTMTISGIAMPCTVGRACSPASCTVGTCLGGVVCQSPFSSLNCPNGCSADGSCLSADGGGFDAGASDGGNGGSNDGGSNDAGSNDAGSNDAGSNDAGSNDAGSNDAGSDDAGFGDAGFGDAGSGDAGSGDAGSKDAGSGKVDAGTGNDGLIQFTSCGCSGGSALPLLLLALALTRSARRVRPLPDPL